MNMDALTAIENFASSIFSAGMDFLFTWGEFIGVLSMITLFARARSAGPVKMSPGKFIAGIFTSAMLVSLPAMINAGGVQMGFRLTHLARLHMYNLRRLALLLTQQMQFCRWPSWPVLDL